MNLHYDLKLEIDLDSSIEQQVIDRVRARYKQNPYRQSDERVIPPEEAIDNLAEAVAYIFENCAFAEELGIEVNGSSINDQPKKKYDRSVQ